MTLSTLTPYRFTLRRTVAAIAMATASAGAFAALPPFTLNPSAVALNGATFTADNMLISDYSTVTLSGTTFNETGFLAVSSFQIGGSTFTPAGLNSDYGLFFQFTGAGTVNAVNPAIAPSFGSFTSLSYTLFGYNGTGTFGFSGNTPTQSSTSAPFALGTGSLISGGVSTIPAGDGVLFTPSASATLTFAPTAAGAGFFQSPTPFYNTVLTAFTNTTSTVEPFEGGFRIRQGGGAVNFVSTVPEPGTYAMLLAGLGAVGLIARRRRV